MRARLHTVLAALVALVGFGNELAADVSSRFEVEGAFLSFNSAGGGDDTGRRLTFEGGIDFSSDDGLWVFEAALRAEKQHGIGTDTIERLELRQFNIGRRGDRFEVSLGLDQLNWGRGDRVRVLDRLHGFEASELVFRDLKDYRRPDWMIRTEYFYDGGSVEFAVLPEASVDRRDFGNRYILNYPQQFRAAGITTQDPSGNDRLRIGLRWNFNAGLADWSLVAIDGPSSEGAARTEASPGGLRLVYEHPRETLFGFGIERPIGAFVARGEFAYIKDRPLSISTGSGLAITQSDAVAALAGIDWQPSNWFVGAQVVQSEFLSAPATIAQADSLGIASVTVRRGFGQGLYQFSSTLSTDLSADDLWLQMGLTYDPGTSPYKLSLKAHSFSGDRTGFFGRLKDDDLVSLTVTGTW